MTTVPETLLVGSINKQISFMYIEYSTAFHMKFKHLFSENIYDSDQADKFPLVITWAESNMDMEYDDRCLAISAKTAHYDYSYQVSEEFFEDALQAFFLFPDTKDDDEDSSKLRLEFVKALLNK